MKRLVSPVLLLMLLATPSLIADNCDIVAVFTSGGRFVGWNCTGDCPGTDPCNTHTVTVGTGGVDTKSYCWCGDPQDPPPPPPGACHGEWIEFDDGKVDLDCEGFCLIKEVCKLKITTPPGLIVVTCDCQ